MRLQRPVVGPGPDPLPPSQYLLSVVTYCWQVVPACVFVEHRVVDPYLNSLRYSSLKPFRFHLQDLHFIQVNANIILVIALNMILLLFCSIIFHEFPFKIDTNHNGIYLGTMSIQWSCGMRLTLCVNGHEFKSGSVLEHGWWD